MQHNKMKHNLKQNKYRKMGNILIIGLTFLLMMGMTFAQTTITDLEDTPVRQVLEPQDQIITFSGQVDKRDPQLYNIVTSFFRNLFSGQLFSFAQSDYTIDDATGAQGDLCVLQKTNPTYTVYRGGLRQDGTYTASGARCDVGDYIKFSTYADGKPIFDKLWYKSNTNDNFRWADYYYTREGIFDNFGVEKLEYYYSCYSCNPVVVPGCTDPSASNYQSDATENDGSCTYSTCEEFANYVLSNGVKTYDRCFDSNTRTNYYCEGTSVKREEIACSTGKVCEGGYCIDKPQDYWTPNNAQTDCIQTTSQTEFTSYQTCADSLPEPQLYYEPLTDNSDCIQISTPTPYTTYQACSDSLTQEPPTPEDKYYTSNTEGNDCVETTTPTEFTSYNSCFSSLGEEPPVDPPVEQPSSLFDTLFSLDKYGYLSYTVIILIIITSVVVILTSPKKRRKK